jgi:glycosyltransferase involved in cell wall biosynthesis
LYHGNLSVAENYTAAMQLIKHVFSKVDIKCVIAGNNPPKELEKLATFYPNVELKTGVSNDEIHDLIREAHINVLHTNQNTGIKLKLLNALYLGKFAVVNPLMVDGSGLEPVCVVGKNFDQMVDKINEYILLDYSEAYAKNRAKFLAENYNSSVAIERLLSEVDFSDVEQPQRQSENTILNSLSQFSGFLSYFSL